MKFEFEEKEDYTLEEVQGIVNDFKTLSSESINEKETELQTALTEGEKVKELQEGNHLLQISNLAIKNGIDEDLLDLIFDKDIEIVKSKIDKLKSIAKEKEIDNSFKPTKNREDDVYTKAINDKDPESALKSKFSRLFGQ